MTPKYFSTILVSLCFYANIVQSTTYENNRRHHTETDQPAWVTSSNHNPSNIASPPDIETHELFTLHDYSGTASFDVISIYTGKQANEQRIIFSKNPHQTISSQYLHYYTHQFPNITLAHKIDYSDNAISNTITISEHYNITQFWQQKRNKLYTTMHGTALKSYTILPQIINRKTPINIEHPLHIQHIARIKFPDPIQFSIADNLFTLKDAAFSFQRQTNYTHQTLEVHYQYITKQDTVMPYRMSEYVVNLNSLNENLYYAAWIYKPTDSVQIDIETSALIEELLHRLNNYSD